MKAYSGEAQGTGPGRTCDESSLVMYKLCCQTAVHVFTGEAQRGSPDQLSGFKAVFTGNEKVTATMVLILISTQWELDH